MNNSEVAPAMPSYIFELEQGLLFIMLFQSSALNEIAAHLNPQCFTHPHHRIIAACIFNLYNQGKSVDVLLVASALSASGMAAGEFDYNTYLTELCRLNYAPLYYHRDIYLLLQYVIRRDTYELAVKTLLAANDDTADAENLLDNFQAGLYDIATQNLKQPAGTIKPLIGQSIERMQRGLSPDIIPCHFRSIDDVCGGGFALTDLIILAARPSTGKSAFALALARNIASSGNPVALFSLEMSQAQMVHRLISAETGIDLQDIIHGRLTPSQEKAIAYLEGLYNSPIIIDDTPALTLFELRSKARRMVVEYGVKCIIIDYLQLMQAASKNVPREQEVSAISRGLKMIAKDLNILVIALSQLSRAVETRGGDKRPRLSDLRESGAIEQDADGVLFLYRPELYGITHDEDGMPTAKMIEVNIAKYRHAGTGSVKLRFDAAYMRFRELVENGN